MNLQEFSAKHQDEHTKFERVENKRSSRPDLHAFLLLNELFPSNRDMICWGGHDEIALDIELDELEAIITEEQALELIRCGVRFDDGCLKMFV